MISPLQMRKATPADKDAVVAVSLAVDPSDYVPMMFDDAVGNPGPEGFYVAELDGRIVGCHAEDWVSDEDVFFYAMRIHPELQGRGIGTAYAKLQVEGAARNGARHLWLSSASKNVRAHRTVEKNGFVNLGPWIIYEEQTPPEGFAGPVRARAGRAEDLPRVAAFMERLAGQVLADVIPAPGYPYGFTFTRQSDWSVEDLAVVEGDGGLEGVMLLRTCWGEQLYVRKLEGTPEAAADLLAYAAVWGRERGLTKWCISVATRCEHLLAPLGWDPEKCDRWFIFHYAV